MARASTVGNGDMLVCLDACGQVRDVYYPYVGESNHVSGASGNYIHRLGVFVDGEMVWFRDSSWEIIGSGVSSDQLSSFVATNHKHGIIVRSHEVVHNEEDVFLRHFTIENTTATTKTVKLMLAQQFRIHESRRGDTGLYDPRAKAIIHYKGDVSILVNATKGGEPFAEFNIGLFGIEGKEGTYLDAEDGQLGNNPIEHGSVDSVIALPFELQPGEPQSAYYWFVCGHSLEEVHQLNEYVLTETPERLISSTEAYWKAWIEKEHTDLSPLPEAFQRIYKHSLIVMKNHTGNNGGIIASGDTEMLHHGRDTYSYVWPRDAAYIAHAFDETGYYNTATRFYDFISRCIEPGGYLMHKYTSDRKLGSSWHPWLIDGKEILPIQIDETAIVLFVIWKHYKRYRDIEFIESLYNTFIEPAANFLVDYIEPSTGLPKASFDLWEENHGTSTYSSSAVYGGLIAASRFAQLLSKDESARTYEAVAERLRTAIKKTLFDEERGHFVKHVLHDADGISAVDYTVDSSGLYGPLFFEVFETDDEQLQKMVAAVENTLAVHGEAKGYVRYEGDNYYKMQDAESPNPWVITTLWLAKYYIKAAQNLDDLKKPFEILEWATSHASQTGMFAEQMHPHTRAHLSTAPLVWSHAEYVLTVQAYLDRHQALQ